MTRKAKPRPPDIKPPVKYPDEVYYKRAINALNSSMQTVYILATQGVITKGTQTSLIYAIDAALDYLKAHPCEKADTT